LALGKRRPEPSDEPHVQTLREVRRALFRLHKALIEAERAGLERTAGPLTSGIFLQALLQDPDLAWLRPFSGLIVEIDEALAHVEELSERDVGAFVERVHALVAAADLRTEERVASRYGEASRRDPDVLLAHVELMGRIGDAREDGEEG
jgi:hypothetical protein